jgi:glycosyltransferase involved in cell wall biosynthesis
MLSDARIERKNLFNQSPNITYIGAIIPSKGFHVLAKQWHKILAKFPDATLNVVGSGNLYGGSSRLGELGLAEESYEKTFRKFITDSNGKLLNSVILHGIVAQDKKTEIIINTTVGVINPTGRTENCPVSAMDFQSHGVPVVTRYRNGSVDILLNNKTGSFYLFEPSLSKKIIRLIQNRELNQSFGREAIRFFNKRFSTRIILTNWEKFFDHLESEDSLNYLAPNDHFFNNFKFLRIVIRNLRFKLGIRFIPSLIKLETIAVNLMLRLRSN